MYKKQSDRVKINVPVEETIQEPYKCTNPKLHQFLGLKCPCYNVHYKTSFSGANVQGPSVEQTTGFPQFSDPYTKAAMINGAIQGEPLPEFIPDWEGWNRLIWNSQKFYGGKVGEFEVKVEYGENIAGMAIAQGFKKRIQHIVTKTNALVLNLSSNATPGVSTMPNGSFIEFTMTPPCKHVQFAVMSLSLMAGRSDAVRIFVNEQIIQVGDFYCGTATRFSGNTFMGTKFCADDNGEADTVVKIKRESGISKIKIEFANLAKNPQGGRLALTDFLVK